MATNLHDDLELGLEMARAATAISVTEKPDGSILTNADIEVEQSLRALLRKYRPDYLIVGEEEEADGDPHAEYQCIIDPIDGTRDYSKGGDHWATLIGFRHHNEPVVAVATTPVSGDVYSTVVGEESYKNGKPIYVSKRGSIPKARIAYSGKKRFAEIGQLANFHTLIRNCESALDLGNSLAHLSVASGECDMALTSWGSVWDYAALSLIVTNAGGQFTNIAGQPSLAQGPPDRHLKDSALSANRLLTEPTVRFFQDGLTYSMT
jgi:histidinol-phosphatase